jgi:hypothetical protein
MLSVGGMAPGVEFLCRKHKAKKSNSSTGKKKSNAGGFTIPEFRLYSRTIKESLHGTGIKTDKETNGKEQRTYE